MEVWKSAKGFEGIYDCSSFGNVRSLARVDKNGRQRETITLKPSPDSSGYPMVRIGGANKKVHRLIAETFLENPQSLETVNHMDADKNNSSVDNLEWMSREDNIKHAKNNKLFKSQNGTTNPNNKVTDTQLLYLKWYTEAGLTQKEASMWIGVNETHGGRLLKGLHR